MKLADILNLNTIHRYNHQRYNIAMNILLWIVNGCVWVRNYIVEHFTFYINILGAIQTQTCDGDGDWGVCCVCIYEHS